jgi:hypothetical protein
LREGLTFFGERRFVIATFDRYWSFFAPDAKA